MSIATVARRHPLLALATDTPTWAGAACTHYDPEIWFHDTETNTRAETNTALAKLICNHDCPLRDQCRTWAIQQAIPFGVYGGMTAQERRDSGLRYCEKCHAAPIPADSRAKYCNTCRPIVRARRGDKRRPQ